MRVYFSVGMSFSFHTAYRLRIARRSPKKWVMKGKCTKARLDEPLHVYPLPTGEVTSLGKWYRGIG